MEVKGADRYQPEKLAHLEKYAEDQAAGTSPYSLDVSLALLRLYNLQGSTNVTLVAKVLLRALAQLPYQDYHMCIHLVPERVQVEEPVNVVVALAQALESQRLSDFWAAAATQKQLLGTVPGFTDAARRYILTIIGITWQQVPRTVLAEELQLQAQALDTLLKQQATSAGWSLRDTDVVVLPRNSFNSPVQTRSADSIAFESIAPALRCVAWE